MKPQEKCAYLSVFWFGVEKEKAKDTSQSLEDTLGVFFPQTLILNIR